MGWPFISSSGKEKLMEQYLHSLYEISAKVWMKIVSKIAFNPQSTEFEVE